MSDKVKSVYYDTGYIDGYKEGYCKAIEMLKDYMSKQTNIITKIVINKEDVEHIKEYLKILK